MSAESGEDATANTNMKAVLNPGIGGIDLRFALPCRIENVFINTGVYDVQASQQPVQRWPSRHLHSIPGNQRSQTT